MMNDILSLIPALALGVVLGVIFFGGLWLTLQRVLTSRNPALLALVSLALRMAIVVTGFYLIVDSSQIQASWLRLMACLVGFILARQFLIRRLGPSQQVVR